MNWASDYVGLPYEGGGRTREGLDCYGLLALVMKDQFGIEIELFDGLDGRNDEDQQSIAKFWSDQVGSEWREIPLGEEQPGDAVNLVVMRLPHCGVVVGNGMMLHTTAQAGVAIESYTRGRFCRRFRNIYRHRSR